MGLLDSVLGAVTNQGQESQTGAQGGWSGIVGMLASNPQLIQIVTGMLSNGSAQGGLGGMVSKFEQAGLGGAIQSWIGGGPNQPVSGEQITNALGTQTVSNVAAKLGVNPDEAAGQLSQLLPEIINHLTPQGQTPQQGLGDSSDMMGMLSGLFKKQ